MFSQVTESTPLSITHISLVLLHIYNFEKVRMGQVRGGWFMRQEVNLSMLCKLLCSLTDSVNTVAILTYAGEFTLNEGVNDYTKKGPICRITFNLL